MVAYDCCQYNGTSLIIINFIFALQRKHRATKSTGVRCCDSEVIIYLLTCWNDLGHSIATVAIKSIFSVLLYFYIIFNEFLVYYRRSQPLKWKR